MTVFHKPTQLVSFSIFIARLTRLTRHHTAPLENANSGADRSKIREEGTTRPAIMQCTKRYMRTLLSRNFTIRCPLAAFSAGRSERPEGATDTTGFWSRGVQNSTRARKFRVDAVHAGRSMIEMLGVLALVGVLSVGGIAGYSKAMWMYKTNKQSEQFGVIIRALFNNKERLNETRDVYYTVVPLLKAMGEIPDEMIIPNDNTYIKDAFGLKYRIYHHFDNFFAIGTTILPSSEDSANICKNLYALGKKFRSDIHFMEIQKNDSDFVSHAYGDKYCTTDRKCLKDLAPHEVDNLCKVCNGDDSCEVFFILWYNR